MSDGSSQPETAEQSGTASPPRVNLDLRDMNVERVRQKLLERSRRGVKKYGVTTDRTDLSLTDWLRHTQEELLDGAVYLERLIQEITGGLRIPTREEFFEFEAKRAKTVAQIEGIESDEKRGGSNG